MNSLHDNTCFDLNGYGGCPPRTIKCPSESISILTFAPTISPTNSPTKKVVKTPGTPVKLKYMRLPTFDEICSKACDNDTKGLPCIHNNWDDTTCYNYMWGTKFICPPSTTDCSSVFNAKPEIVIPPIKTPIKTSKTLMPTVSPSESPTLSPTKKPGLPKDLLNNYCMEFCNYEHQCINVISYNEVYCVPDITSTECPDGFTLCNIFVNQHGKHGVL